MKKIIIAIIAIVAVGGGGYLLLHENSDGGSKKSSDNTSQSAASSNNSVPSGATSSDQPAAATITYSDSGFSPSTVTVKAGDTIAIKNTSSRDMQFDSDPHPNHTDDEELNVGIVSPGQTMTFKVEKTGSHGYHNHLSASDTGTIVVQ